jgi:predicted permease
MLSMVLVWLINPAVVLKAFQIDFTPEVRDRFLLAAGVAVAVNLLLMLITWGYGKLLKLDAVERTSIMYANAGNLVIPLVSAILGDEWVIYASAFMCVQLAFLWTHGVAQIGGSGGSSWKKILLNANLIAIVVGAVMLLTGLRLPPVIQNVCGQLGGTIGPVSMIMLGMLLADVKWGELLRQPRNWLVMALKMVVTPIVVLMILRLSGVTGLVEDGKTIVYISFMAVITPCATTVTQLAQMYRNRPAYASALNAMTTVISIVSMPLMTGLYYLIM